ncbi:MAG: hypothetical protein IPN27_12035 [Cellvibrionales bacterium]|nr:hypothetical protein [Cellvibrionales bacterium]
MMACASWGDNKNCAAASTHTAKRLMRLGKPIVDAARLEAGQKLIGASFCTSMANQHIPPRFSLKFDQHIKDSHRNLWGGHMLDWPRHWRRTRKTDLVEAISMLNTNAEHSAYYENTFDLVAYSQDFSNMFESREETSIRTQYEQFSWSNTSLIASVRPVRMIQIVD